MKKLIIIALLPLLVACKKSSHRVEPQTTSPAAMKSTSSNGGSNSSGYQLISFKVAKHNYNTLFGRAHTNKLTWTATGETNITGYDIEFSTDNFVSYNLVVFVPSSNSNTSYSNSRIFGAIDGINYYRLKIYHVNQPASYSSVLSTNWNL